MAFENERPVRAVDLDLVPVTWSMSSASSTTLNMAYATKYTMHKVSLQMA